MRLLLVDDDPEVAHVVRIALSETGGHEVDWASTAEEALERVREVRPDAIVMDVLLPDMDGTELLALLRRRPGLENVPVVFLTGKADPDRLAALRAAGAVGVIAKPFDPLSLGEEVGRILGASAAGP